MERLDMELKNIDNVSHDIAKEFYYANIMQIAVALRNGSLGHYGSTYRLNTQELCIWIRKYLGNDKKFLL